MSGDRLVSVDDVRAAATAIAPFVRRTPLIAFSPARDTHTWLKAESLQVGGSFKLRGATYAVSRLTADDRRRGVVTHSSGNHAQAVARAGRTFGVAVTVVMPYSTPQVKLDATRAHGAEIVLVDAAERESTVVAISERTGAAVIPPFDDAAVIAGQGTVGLEIAEQLPTAATIYVPVSGGGLISGMSVALKALVPTVRVVAVEPALAGDLAQGWVRGERVHWPAEATGRTIADGLRVTGVGELNWRHIRALVDDVITVSEEQIVQSVRSIVLDAKLVCEPSGAVALAGLLADPGRVDPSVAVVSGANVDPGVLSSMIAEPAG